MPRVYSKTGCSRCKVRRVKCDEKRPVCTACAKWKWPCSYEPHQSDHELRSDWPAKVQADESIVRLALPSGLQPYRANEMEVKVLRDIPESIKAFYSPSSGDRIQDLQTMFQLMTSNDLLRHAGVACFSAIIEKSMALAQLTRETYGKALQSLRAKVLCDSLDQEDLICVIASIVFLGKMESFGPNPSADALEHWMALIPLLKSDKVIKLMNQNVLPQSEVMLIFESLLYHVGTHAIFSRATDRVWRSWQTHGTYLRLLTMNPDGPNKLSRSPFLFGQYELYNLAFQLSHLLRSYRDGHIESDIADQMETSIWRKDRQLGNGTAKSEPATIYTAKYEAECAIYHFFCNSLLICVTALREPSQSQRDHVNQLVESGMKMFLDLPEYGNVELLSQHANHFMLAAIWPILVQGCATYDASQFQIFMDHYSKLEQFLDPGHERRSRILLTQVSKLLDSLPAEGPSRTCAENKNRALPIGLTLLRNSSGIDEFK